MLAHPTILLFQLSDDNHIRLDHKAKVTSLWIEGSEQGNKYCIADCCVFANCIADGHYDLDNHFHDGWLLGGACQVAEEIWNSLSQIERTGLDEEFFEACQR